jgi:hypothetical protein
VRAELFYVGGQADRPMKKLAVAFSDFANAPKFSFRRYKNHTTSPLQRPTGKCCSEKHPSVFKIVRRQQTQRERLEGGGGEISYFIATTGG